MTVTLAQEPSSTLHITKESLLHLLRNLYFEQELKICNMQQQNSIIRSQLENSIKCIAGTLHEEDTAPAPTRGSNKRKKRNSDVDCYCIRENYYRKKRVTWAPTVIG
ncbi:hypothetical protein AKO1_014910 [Acrasis kona]|uniref:Uncharacterized protein n=1 Tax=Acrasis kona TaxID=1008807 RepID=A0AAW2YZQ6_9EUKA